MHWSQLLIPTRKETPASGKGRGHALLVRAGMAQESAAGAFALLPLGVRSLRKAEQLLLGELPPPAFHEIVLPAAAGNADVAELVAEVARSYRQFPLRLFSRRMLDADRSSDGGPSVCEGWAFHTPDEGGGANELRDCLVHLLRRCALEPILADAGGAGPDGTPTAFVIPLESGDDVILASDRGGYAALAEWAQTGSRSWTFGEDPAAELEKVHTPGLTSVEQVAAFLKVPPARVLKTLVFRTDATGPAQASGVDPRWVVAVVRGDDSVHEAKLDAVVRETFHVGIRPLTDGKADEATFADWAVGFVGPDAATRKPEAVLVVDYDAAGGASWVAGANEAGYHVRHFNWFRECGDRLADPRKTTVADIRPARAGDPAPRGGTLAATAGVEIARVTPLGDRLTRPAGASVTRADGTAVPARMAACRLDLTRLLTTAAAVSHDQRGIVWPQALAPFTVVVTALGADGETAQVAVRLYEEMNAAGIDTILDDRDARPGVKFADADLIGFPVRVTVGDRGLREGVVEVKARRSSEPQMVPVDSVIDAVRAALEG